MMHEDLSPSISEWLDDHINYERRGPGNASVATHDPKLRIQRMRSMLSLLDDPQLKFPSVHLTGTNGKTSTSRMTTQLMLAQGLRTGTFTSPHLQSINERIAVNGEPINIDDLDEVLESIRLIETLIPEADTPTYFEVLTAAAFRHFADAPVDAGVIEVGVGGLYDSTNVIDASVVVITNIGHDHHNFLGPTLEDVATQKAGIVQPHATVVTAETDPRMLAIFEAREPQKLLVFGRDFEVLDNRVAVSGRLLTLRTPRAVYEDLFLSTHGSHQGVNAATALVAAESFFDIALSEDVVRNAFGSVTTPGRFEVVAGSPICVLDGAHNTEGIKRLIATLDDTLTAQDRVFVVGMLEPHDPVEILEALGVKNSRLVVACTADSPRAVPADQIAEAARSLGAPIVVVDGVSDAVGEARAAAGPDDVVVVTGSLYVAGAARTALAHDSS